MTCTCGAVGRVCWCGACARGAVACADARSFWVADCLRAVVSSRPVIGFCGNGPHLLLILLCGECVRTIMAVFTGMERRAHDFRHFAHFFCAHIRHPLSIALSLLPPHILPQPEQTRLSLSPPTLLLRVSCCAPAVARWLRWRPPRCASFASFGAWPGGVFSRRRARSLSSALHFDPSLTHHHSHKNAARCLHTAHAPLRRSTWRAGGDMSKPAGSVPCHQRHLALSSCCRRRLSLTHGWLLFEKYFAMFATPCACADAGMMVRGRPCCCGYSRALAPPAQLCHRLVLLLSLGSFLIFLHCCAILSLTDARDLVFCGLLSIFTERKQPGRASAAPVPRRPSICLQATV